MNSRFRRSGCLRLCCAQVSFSGWFLVVALGHTAAAPAPGTLRGTVSDADTGRPTACTVTLIDASGQTVLEKESFKGGFRSDGRFIKQLPPGQTRVRVTRGFETRAVESVVEIRPDTETLIQVELKRSVDLRRRGWYAGDHHAHMLHGERTVPVTFDDVALAARAEDLQHFSLAQAWIYDSPTPEQLEAELSSRSRPDCVLHWNLEAPKNYYRGDAGRCLGHCWNVSTRGRTPSGHNVIDLLLHASAHDYESDKPAFANFESHQLIHAQGGAVFYSHPARFWMGTWGGRGGYPLQTNQRISNLAVELPLDTLIGPTYDGLDVLTGAGEFHANAKAFELWALLLNHGYRVAATASSDACFDRPGGATPGAVRTYTYLPDGFSPAAAARALVRGHTFVTSGPLLLASVNGKPPGSAIAASGQSPQIAVEAWPSGTDPQGLTRLELLRNGRLVQTHLFSPPTASVRTNLAITGAESAWYCVRVYGGDPQRQRAFSGAFFFDMEPFTPPAPVPARVTVQLLDAATGETLSGSVTEITFQCAIEQPGQTHPVAQKSVLTVPGTVRLRAQSAGYQAQTLSPFLDHPPLVEFITGLGADDLLNWDTYARIRSLLADVPLTFRLHPTAQ